MADDRDARVWEWERQTRALADAGDMTRWELVHQLVLAERGEVRTKEAYEIATELCMVWSRYEARQRPRGEK